MERDKCILGRQVTGERGGGKGGKRRKLTRDQRDVVERMEE